MAEPFYKDHPEFVEAWDLARDEDGKVITITPEQGHAVERALHVLSLVEEAEDGNCAGIYSKSRLLGRMLYEGLPPTKTKPPTNLGAPEWSLLPGGDPFVTQEVKDASLADMDRRLASGTMKLVCHVCGYSGPMFSTRQERDDHLRVEHSL